MKVIVIVDMQNDFITGSLGSPEAVEVKNKMIKYLREQDYDNTKVIFTMDTHDKDYLESYEGKKLPIPHCIFDTEGWKINEELYEIVPADNRDTQFKQTFGSLDLTETVMDAIIEAYLYNDTKEFIDEIEIVGVCTDICVVSNALILRAYYPNTKIKVISELCAGTSKEAHNAALTVMNSCQIDIV
jgi:nicotinamidase-related amidase